MRRSTESSRLRLTRDFFATIFVYASIGGAMRTTSLPVLNPASSARNVDAQRLRQLALDCGADDAGLVEIGDPALDDQRADILRFYPRTKTLLAVACRM